MVTLAPEVSWPDQTFAPCRVSRDVVAVADESPSVAATPFLTLVLILALSLRLSSRSNSKTAI